MQSCLGRNKKLAYLDVFFLKLENEGSEVYSHLTQKETFQSRERNWIHTNNSIWKLLWKLHGP